MDKTELSQKWKDRFALFDSAGGDINSPQYKSAIKNMKFLGRIKYVFNFYAFFFGIIYFCILGLWKKGLVMFGAILAFNVIIIIVESATGMDLEALARGVNIGYAGSCATIANYAYYLKEVKGLDSWNPLEGFTKKSSAKIAAM
ncbi:DUF2628 domain-containing protein [Serratia fonticola]|jgi:hypothetical protein|uniref:DUF2628 domain-containing protein n=1 Tax=Serratia fonticola TaxID=47917 RepID=UPI0014154F90|nr:DUF2628 domain-containing protein [Serratia fonticola]MBL5859285.1 DUF2628 domain-containing protein [Serratia fonticola]NXZ85941.1 DUF2628 domain-containing protein [Serratia fonticola]QIP93402.1 hypothetical protein HAP32_03922 [Serratia fonticola]CAI1827439.1 Protein of uncharacterised function (DUF2628) [Serratia fonticola]HEJ9060103.1 DUF2628 domain-containing protein [Serratia fonticola]